MYKGLGEKMETSVACRAVESRRESQRPPYLSSTFTLTTRVPVYLRPGVRNEQLHRPVQMGTVSDRDRKYFA